MKNKNKKKILRFIAVFSIISILFVALAFPISALDIGGGATLTGTTSDLFIGAEGEGTYYEGVMSESSNQISFQFNLGSLDGYGSDGLIMSNKGFYFFNSSNNYGTLTLSIRGLGGSFFSGVLEEFGIYETSTNKKVSSSSDITNNFDRNFTISYTGYIPSNFYIFSVWNMVPDDFPLASIVTFNLSFTPRNEVADKLDEDKYPSFDYPQDKIDDSQQIEDDSLNNASGFIDNTFDFVFDRSLFTEGNFINGLRAASNTFERFASIPFIGTILKYAVIFGLIGFVLGLATFVMRRRR